MMPSNDNKRKRDKDRSDRIRLLARTLYGEIPPRPTHFDIEKTEEIPTYLGTKATLLRCNLIFELECEHFSLKAESVVPNGGGQYPTFILVYMRDDKELLPIEEIIDNGCALIMAEAESLAEDSADFRSREERILTRGRWKDSRPGKIALWAWEYLRLFEYAESCSFSNITRTAVIGHRHLAASALYAAAQNEKIKYMVSNCGGVGVDSLPVTDRDAELYRLVSEFPHRYTRGALNSKRDAASALDLLALCAPRHIAVGAALDDPICDAAGQFRALCELVRLYYAEDMTMPNEADVINAPCTIDSPYFSFHTKRGASFLGREDWQHYIRYLKL